MSIKWKHQYPITEGGRVASVGRRQWFGNSGGCSFIVWHKPGEAWRPAATDGGGRVTWLQDCISKHEAFRACEEFLGVKKPATRKASLTVEEVLQVLADTVEQRGGYARGSKVDRAVRKAKEIIEEDSK